MAEVKDYLYAAQANARIDVLEAALPFLSAACSYRENGVCTIKEVCPAWEVCWSAEGKGAGS